jgi:hypothetical protein
VDVVADQERHDDAKDRETEEPCWELSPCCRRTSYTVCSAFVPLSCKFCAVALPSLEHRHTPRQEHNKAFFLAHQLLGEMPE